MKQFFLKHKNFIIKVLLPKVFLFSIIIWIFSYNYIQWIVIARCNIYYFNEHISEPIKSLSLTSFNTKCIVNYQNWKEYVYNYKILKWFDSK